MLTDRLASNSLASQRPASISLDFAAGLSMGSATHLCILPRRLPVTFPAQRHAPTRVDVQCNASRKRRTQASAVHPSSAADRLGGLLLRGPHVQPSVTGEEFPIRLAVADTVEQLERSLQASPTFAEPITKRKRGRKPKNALAPRAPAASLFDTPSRGRLTTIKSTKGSTSLAASKIANAPSDDSKPRRRARHAPRAQSPTPRTRTQSPKRTSPTRSPFDEDAEVVWAVDARLAENRAAIKTTTASSPDATALFLRNIANTSVLSRKEEYALARMVQRGLAADAAVQELSSSLGRTPSDAEVAEHMKLPASQSPTAVQALADKARELLLQHNLRLAVSVCKRYLGRGVELSDLVPEAINNLNRAITKFDPSKGFKFSTYAHWWIRQAVIRSVNEYSRIVRLPVHVCDLVNKINRVAQDLDAQPERTAPPTAEDIAAVLGIPATKVEAYMSISKPARSLESPAFASGTSKDGDPVTLMDTIATTSNPEEHQYESAVEQLMREDINALLSTLPPRERNVIRMRYGLQGGANGSMMTFKDIGTAYGLSTERVRQIEDKALSKLRRPWRQKLLRPHLYSGTARDA